MILEKWLGQKVFKKLLISIVPVAQPMADEVQTTEQTTI